MKILDWHDAIPYAKAVYARHCAGCCAHIVTDDCNVEDECVQWSLDRAHSAGHEDCIALLEVLRQMTLTQRTKLHHNYRLFAQ